MGSASVSGRPGATILVVEDEWSVRDALIKILSNYGHIVFGVEDGEKALREFTKNPAIQIVLTDLSLPGMSGWEVARKIRELAPAMPIVLLSGWDVEESSDEFRKSGIDRILPKPVKIKEMLAVVDELVNR